MRIVGKVNLPSVGLRGPTPDEVKASIESSRQAPRLAPTGVYRYRNHAEANAAMDRWIAEAMVRRALELALQKSVALAAPKGSKRRGCLWFLHGAGGGDG
jgi:hypothetical protein